MVMLHGLMVAGPCLKSKLRRYWGPGMDEPRGASWGLEQCSSRSGRLSARPRTEAPQTRIYFITHGSAAFPVPRVRTVARGERAPSRRRRGPRLARVPARPRDLRTSRRLARTPIRTSTTTAAAAAANAGGTGASTRTRASGSASAARTTRPCSGVTSTSMAARRRLATTGTAQSARVPSRRTVTSTTRKTTKFLSLPSPLPN